MENLSKYFLVKLSLKRIRENITSREYFEFGKFSNGKHDF
jgi:hypothetical protein